MEPVLTVVGVLIAVTYLFATFAPNAPLFGRVARSRQTAASFALTFDDGPDPRFTPLISSYLADRGHRATFFVLGKAAAAHPDVLAKVAADGHEIASHGNDHRLLAFSSPRVIDEQLAVSETAILEATGHSPPPINGNGDSAEPLADWGRYILDRLADRWGIRGGPQRDIWAEVEV